LSQFTIRFDTTANGVDNRPAIYLTVGGIDLVKVETPGTMGAIRLVPGGFMIWREANSLPVGEKDLSYVGAMIRPTW